MQSALEEAAGSDFVRREQLMDFVRMRGYRETLLCKADREVPRGLSAQPFRLMRFASQTTVVPGEAPGAMAFVLPGGIRMQSNHPGVTALLTRLSSAWPHALGFDELEPLLVESGMMLDREGAGLLMRLAVSKMIELRTWNAPVAPAVTECPKASACSRQEARHGQPNATSLLHKTVSLEDAKVRHLLELLDGTRDRGALLQAMQAGFPDMPPGELAVGLDPGLKLFYATGVLEA
jgi:methyltransferase-like protein